MSAHKYDEDISNNSFFIKLKNEYKILLETAAMEKWIICLPRQSSINLNDLNKTDFILSHILAPNEEIPGYHFTSLIGDDFELHDKMLNDRKNEQKRQILFEETFYTQEFYKLRIWCLSFPLISNYSQYCDFNSITNVTEASNFLLLETNSPTILKILANICGEFLHELRPIKELKIEQMKCGIEKLLEKAVKIVLSRKSLREKFNSDIYKMQKLEISLALCVSSQLYDFVFEIVGLSNLEQSEKFNRAMQSMGEVTIEDLRISQDYLECLPAVRKQMGDIGSYRTPAGKLECIKRAIDKVTNKNASKPLVDDLIPIITHAILKSGYTHWITTVNYIAEFINFFEKNFENGYENFLLTTLEAAVYFILSENMNFKTFRYLSNTESQKPKMNYKSKDDFLRYLFQQIESNNEVEALKLLNVSATNEKEIFNIILDNRALFANAPIDECCGSLCHPLCDCTTCQKKVEENSPNINSNDDHGRTALHIAAAKGHPRMLSILISLGANVEAIDENNWTPLHYAACNGQQNVLLLLLHSNANINGVTKNNSSALHLSSLNGHTGCVNALLYYADHMKVQHNINHMDSFGNTALHIASKWGFSDIVENLLEFRAQINVKNKLGITPIQIAHNTKIRKLLETRLTEQTTSSVVVAIKNQKDNSLFKFNRKNSTETQNVRRKLKKEPIFNAIRNNDVRLLDFYLKIDYDRDKETQTDALLNNGRLKNDVIASCDESFEKMQLIDNLYNETGMNPLQYAASLNRTEILKILALQGSNVDHRNKFGQTALHVACENGNTAAVGMLLNFLNVLINVQDNLGNTPLHYAVKIGNFEIIQMMLQHFPDLSIRNKDGLTPIDIARKMMFLNILALLEKVAD